MDNYVHMAAKVEAEKLSAAFKRLNIKYAMYYNKIHNTTGHVFHFRTDLRACQLKQKSDFLW